MKINAVNTVFVMGIVSIISLGISKPSLAEGKETPFTDTTSNKNTKIYSVYGENKSDDEQIDNITSSINEITKIPKADTSRLVMTQVTEDHKAGYFNGANLSFSLQEGAKIPAGFDPAKKYIMTTHVKRMIKIEFLLNNKTITIQAVPDGQELYIKGTDSATKQVIYLNTEEKTLIKKMLRDGSSLPAGLSKEHELYFIGALSIMANWPETVPLFHWSSENEVIAAISSDKAVTISRNQAALYNREAEVIIPFDSSIADKQL